MTVPARDNGFGEHQFAENFAKHHIYNNYKYPEESRSWVEYELGVPVHTCNRGPKSSNQPRLLTLSGPAWRDPSKYSRNVSDITHLLGRHKNQSGLPFWDLDFEVLNREWLFNWDFEESRFAVAAGVPWPSDLESEAITKVIKKLKDRKASIGEDLAEAGKTYHSLTTEIGNLARALYAVKHGNIREAVRRISDGRGIVRRGADLFLQYKYGWKPIMSDIYGMTELLKEQCKPAMLMTASARTKPVNSRLLPKAGFDRKGSVDIRGRLALTGMVNPNQARLPDRIGLSNPLSLAWELVPYSFVVDWFIPIGDILDAMTPPLGLDFVGGSCTFHYEGELYSRILPTPGSEEVTPAETTYRVFSLNRTNYSEWPKPGLFVTSPFTPGHGFSSLALALQRMFR